MFFASLVSSCRLYVLGHLFLFGMVQHSEPEEIELGAAIHHAFTEVFLFRQRKLIEHACRDKERTSAKDIRHLSKAMPAVSIMFCLRLGTHLPKKLSISGEFCFQLHHFEICL